MSGSRNKSTPKLKPVRASSKRQIRKPTIAIVGAGRLGTALGVGVKNAGYPVGVVIAKHAISARRAAKLIGKRTSWLAMPPDNRLRSRDYDRLRGCELIVISTPDDVIPLLAKQLGGLFRAQGMKSNSRKRVALHTSGALSSDVLTPLRRVGIATGTLHPLVSISDAHAGRTAFRGAFFAIEGDRLSRRVATSLVNDLGGESFSIAPEAKALYHAAAVTASGHVTALFDIALEMLVESGLSRRRAQQILLPLLKSTANNLATKDPSHALTGPFARGDVSTAKRHLAAIKSAHLTDASNAYVLLGKRSLRLAKARASLDNLDQLRKLLTLATSRRSKR